MRFLPKIGLGNEGVTNRSFFGKIEGGKLGCLGKNSYLWVEESLKQAKGTTVPFSEIWLQCSQPQSKSKNDDILSKEKPLIR